MSPASLPVGRRCPAGATAPAEITINKMKNKKKFSITWDEYHECSATVEAESEEEAQEKWSKMEYLDFGDDVQNIDNIKIFEEEDGDEQENEIY